MNNLGIEYTEGEFSHEAGNTAVSRTADRSPRCELERVHLNGLDHTETKQATAMVIISERIGWNGWCRPPEG
jgi:hypothetical protein